MSIEDFYIDCTRERPTYVLDQDTNRPNVTFTTTAIMGYLSNSQTDVAEIKTGKYTTTVQKYFYTDDFNIVRGDFINYENKRFEVIGVPKDTAHRGNHIKVLTQYIKDIKQ